MPNMPRFGSVWSPSQAYPCCPLPSRSAPPSGAQTTMASPKHHVVRLTREKVPLRRSQDLQTTDDSTKPRRRDDSQLACLASSTSEGWLSPTTIRLCVAWVPHFKRFFCNSLVVFRGSTILRICTSVSTPPSNEELLEFQSGRNLFGLG